MVNAVLESVCRTLWHSQPACFYQPVTSATQTHPPKSKSQTLPIRKRISKPPKCRGLLTALRFRCEHLANDFITHPLSFHWNTTTSFAGTEQVKPDLRRMSCYCSTNNTLPASHQDFQCFNEQQNNIWKIIPYVHSVNRPRALIQIWPEVHCTVLSLQKWNLSRVQRSTFICRLWKQVLSFLHTANLLSCPPRMEQTSFFLCCHLPVVTGRSPLRAAMLQPLLVGQPPVVPRPD